jgi:tetratricopeptide (TPR) repeat protein
MSDPVSETYVQRFNQAAGLARVGEHERALVAYEHVFDPLPDGEPAEASDRFRATVEMRHAWVLMDLGRYEEARSIFEGPLAALSSSMTQLDLHELLFSYGNTLAWLKADGLRHAFEQAIAIAEHSLCDLALFERSWERLLAGLERLEDWTELDWKAHVCHREGVRLDSPRMQLIAGEYATRAWRGLGDVQRAQEGARKILARLQSAGVRGSRFAEWQRFLTSVSASA